MSKGVILHLDNDFKGVLQPSKNLFDQIGFDLDYITCQTKEEFKEALDENEKKIKALIFDLLSEEPSKGELHQKDAQFLENMRDSFAAYNIPIFVYSGYLQALENEFDDYGTVYKVDKEHGIQPVFDKLKLLFDSGFIDVFCPGGVLESEIKEELNKSFTKQFSQNLQIEEVINSILSSEPGDKSDRVKKVFKRITIRTLAADLLAPVADSEDKVHPIEHFYKRQSKLDIWTGDIWKKKEGEQQVLVLTPRCDFATGKAKTLIYCIIEKSQLIKLTGKPEEVEKRLRDYLTDNLPGKVTRYIPSNVFFPDGGIVNLACHETKLTEEFLKEYKYIITLSDDLTNEIIGKFAYYFLRTGITNINEQEFQAIIKAMNPKENGEK